MSAARPGSEAAGPGGSRRSRRRREAGAGRLHWAWPAALALVALSFHLGRFGRNGEEEDGAEVLARLDLLDRMALVYVSALSDAPDRSFFLDRYEVTNGEFAAFAAATGYLPDDPAGYLLHLGGPRAASASRLASRDVAARPVVHVSLSDARAYARSEGKELPTVAEWMLAARGADPSGPLGLNAAEAGLGGPARVGSFESARTRMRAFVGPPVYDLLGNVWEWTVTPAAGRPGAVVVKGGSFLESTRRIRPASIRFEEPENRNFALGFRCVVRNAEQLVREVLERLTDASEGVREEVVQRLRRFGEPLRRLLARLRFDDRVTWRGGRGLGVDHVVALADGRVVLGGFEGALRVVDGRTGVVLGRRDDLGRIDEAVAADLDRDGESELYLVTALDGPGASEGARDDEYDADVAEPELFLMRDVGGAIRVVDPLRGGVVPWVDGPLGEVARRALDLDWSEFLDPTEERDCSLLLLLGTYAGEQTPPPPLFASDPERHGWFYGYVPRERRRLLRLDPASSSVSTVWERRVPVVERLLPVEARGELLLAGSLTRRFLFDPEERPDPDNRILALRAVDADGAVRSETLVPGGSASLAALDDRADRLLVVTHTGHEVLLDRTGEEPAAALLRETRRSYYVDRVTEGPAPFAATLQVVELDEEFEPREVRLEGYDRLGRLVGSADVPLRDGAPPRRFPVIGDDSTLLLWPDATLVRLGPDLRERWRRDEAAEVALERGGAVAVDFDRDGRLEYCVPWRLDGFLRLDAETGRVVDGYRNPNALVFALHRRFDEGRAGLLATVADLGVLAFGPVRSAVDDEARRLLERLEAPPPGATGARREGR
ncbi:MAG: SUMF1/EgtB/PvdO family nonheme iron enzyme [Planctomycetota bacterium JB042]